MANILDVLASTFTTCACGAAKEKKRECALMWMRRFVDGEEGEDGGEYLNCDRDRDGGGNGDLGRGCEASGSGSAGGRDVDLGPLLGVERGFRTQERVARAGGIGGVEMCVSASASGSRSRSGGVRGRRSNGKEKGKGKERAVVDEDEEVDVEVEVDVELADVDVDGDETEDDEILRFGTFIFSLSLFLCLS